MRRVSSAVILTRILPVMAAISILAATAFSQNLSIPNEELPKQAGPSGKIIERRATYKYLCFLPRTYDEGRKKLPLLLFLHGAGCKGDDLKPLYSHGPIEYLSSKNDNRFIAISPLCPKNSGWIPSRLNKFLHEIVRYHPIDTSRIYLTGMSMGGHGTWAFACEYPQYFAAIAPLCGAGDPNRAALKLANMPTWVVHGVKDTIVPVKYGERMISALQAAGAPVKASIFPEMGHGEVLSIYQQEEFYSGCSHRRKNDRKRRARQWNPTSWLCSSHPQLWLIALQSLDLFGSSNISRSK